MAERHAGYDLDALWNWRHMREGYVWVGVSAQRVGVNQLSAWSPTRYGTLDVTGGGAPAPSTQRARWPWAASITWLSQTRLNGGFVHS